MRGGLQRPADAQSSVGKSVCMATGQQTPQSQDDGHAEPQLTGGGGMLNAIPSTIVVLGAITAIQVGVLLATNLFPAMSAAVTDATRIIFAAIVLSTMARG